MSNEEKEDIKNLFDAKFDAQNKKLNNFLTLATAIAVVFISIAVGFMVSNSRENGVQNTEIQHIKTNQAKLVSQMVKTTEILNKMVSNDKIKMIKLEEIDKALDDILVRVHNSEFAILSGDNSLIVRGQTVKEEDKN